MGERGDTIYIFYVIVVQTSLSGLHRFHWDVSPHEQSGGEANSDGHLGLKSPRWWWWWCEGASWLPSCTAAPMGKTGRSEGLLPVTNYTALLPASCQAQCQEHGLVLHLLMCCHHPPPQPGPIFRVYARPGCRCRWW